MFLDSTCKFAMFVAIKNVAQEPYEFKNAKQNPCEGSGAVHA